MGEGEERAWVNERVCVLGWVAVELWIQALRGIIAGQGMEVLSFAGIRGARERIGFPCFHAPSR
jgi:hypothetical protein